MTFNASASAPGWNGTHPMPLESYAWNFGDGTPQVTEADPITTHNYTADGSYMVTLNVTDGQGLWNTVSKIVTISDGDVVARIPGDANGDGQADIFDLTMLGMTWYRRWGDPGFDGRADFNLDGVVDIFDLVILGRNWYKQAPAA